MGTWNMGVQTVLVSQLFVLVSLSTAYGPFYGNRDLLCNRGTRFACYCSTVTWRRFNRTDAPLCSQLFPGFEAAILELATCDVRLENNQIAQTISQDYEDSARSATTFERYFKRTLATLIKKECQQRLSEPRCSKIPPDLNEEHIVFTSYQCSKDLRTSRLWMIVVGRPERTVDLPQEATHFVDGSSIARVLTSASLLPLLNSHLLAKNSRLMDVHHSRLEGTFERTSVPKVNSPLNDADSDRDHGSVKATVGEEHYDDGGAQEEVEYETESDKSVMENGDDVIGKEKNQKFNWVAAVVGTLFVLYFVIVWVLSVIFCLKKRREIQAKNRRLRGEMTDEDHGGIQDERQNRRVESNTDAPTTKKLMSRDEDSDYDNN